MADAIVKIGGDTSAFTGALDRAKQQATSWGSGIKGTLTSSLAGVFASAAIANELKEIVHEFANIEDIASRSDVGIGFLLSIKQQAKEAGTSLEEAAKAVKKFTIAANDSTSGEAMSGVLKSLGTSLEQVRAMNGEELFATLAKAVGGVSTQAEKLQVLNILLGDAGGRMESLLPLLQDVAKNGVAAVSEEMVKATKDAAALEDRLSGLSEGIKSVVLPTLLAFLKILEGIGYAFVKFFVQNPFKAVYNGADAAKNAALALWEAMKLNRQGVDEYAAEAQEAFKKVFTETWENTKEMGNGMKDIFDSISKSADATGPVNATNSALEEQLRIQRDIAKAAEGKAAAEKEFSKAIENAKKRGQEAFDEEKSRQDGLETWRENQRKQIAGMESELKQLTGSGPSSPTLASVGEKLKEIDSLKREGQQAVVSSRTAMGLGGGASSLTVDPRRLEKLQEDQLATQKTLVEEIGKIQSTIDGLASALDES